MAQSVITRSVLLSAASLALLLAGQGEGQDRTEALYQEAKLAQSRGDLKGATRKFCGSIRQ